MSALPKTSEENSRAWFGSATFGLTSKWIGVDGHTV